MTNKDASLDKIWRRFDGNKDDVIDRAEFDRLLLASLQVFHLERNPKADPPTREAMDPFIEKLRNELAPRVDTDHDGVISKPEFEAFGDCTFDICYLWANSIGA